jgi:hypothetical protein
MPTLSWEGIRKRGSEATAAISGAPEPGELWQSIAGYVARGVRGDPRGRKPGAGPEATNPIGALSVHKCGLTRGDQR